MSVTTNRTKAPRKLPGCSDRDKQAMAALRNVIGVYGNADAAINAPEEERNAVIDAVVSGDITPAISPVKPGRGGARAGAGRKATIDYEALYQENPEGKSTVTLHGVPYSVLAFIQRGVNTVNTEAGSNLSVQDWIREFLSAAELRSRG